MNKSDLWVYDIETYPNVFTLAIGNMQTRKMTVFEISSRKDEREKMFEYLDDVRKRGGYMVGFNNVGFDYPVVHYILNNQKCSVLDVYHKAMSIIKSDDRFGSIVRDKDCYVKQIDLYKIHHFDNAARATSLKMLEFNMRMDNIEDLPFDVGVCLTNDQIDILIKYNAHDVKATAMFLEKSLNQIGFRVGLGELYGKNMLNFNDTKIGKDHFVTELEKHNEGCCYKRVGGQRMMMQTKRDKIDLDDCIFGYVKFDRPEFDAVLQWFKSKTITETKGVFTDILESELGDVAKYAVLKKKRIKQFSKPSDGQIEVLKQKHSMGWLSEEQLKSGKVSYWWNWNVAESLNVVVDGLEYVFGTGGIHASVEAQVVESDDDWIIVDRDVKLIA